MDVTVERYMRRKIVTDSASPQFFYLQPQSDKNGGLYPA